MFWFIRNLHNILLYIIFHSKLFSNIDPACIFRYKQVLFITLDKIIDNIYQTLLMNISFFT